MNARRSTETGLGGEHETTGGKTMIKWIVFLAVVLSLGRGLSYYFDHDNRNKRLFKAAETGELSAVYDEATKGADSNSKDSSGVSALYIAAENGHTDVVKLLLEKGADVNVAKRDDGQTPLWRAAEYGYLEIVKLLVAK